jgi:hypothetical protein
MYSGAVDVLGLLTEKLKQQINDTQDMYEPFIDATHLYKQGKMNEKEYIAKIVDYLVSTSASVFLAIRVILEMKSAINNDTLMKNATGGGVGEGGEEYVMPAPEQQEFIFKPVDIELERPSRESSGKETTTTITKKCIVCGSAIPTQAKFCSKCGKLQ